MSLIPSESYSFPDHFSSTVVPSRRPKEEQTSAEKVRTKPTIVALPDPERESLVATNPVESEVIPEPLKPEVPQIKASFPTPNPALRRAQAPPPWISDAPIRKIALRPTLNSKVRWNNRAPAMDPSQARNNGNGNSANEVAPTPASLPAQNGYSDEGAQHCAAPAKRSAMTASERSSSATGCRQAPPPPAGTEAPAPVRKPLPVAMSARPVQPQRIPQKAQPPAPVAANPQADFFEMFADVDYEAASKRRRQMKFRRFVACEIAAVAVLLPLIILGLTLNITAPALRWLLDIFTIAAAVSFAIIPIVFYAGTSTEPELER
jgi:hypothetical protein